MLDICMYRGVDNEGRAGILHSFYEKGMASNKVIMARSAQSQKTKISTLSQEIVRRLKNTARGVGVEEIKLCHQPSPCPLCTVIEVEIPHLQTNFDCLSISA